jgi:hypothetical protein
MGCGCGGSTPAPVEQNRAREVVKGVNGADVVVPQRTVGGAIYPGSKSDVRPVVVKS